MSTADITEERVLDADAVALFEAVHEHCGAGVVRDREWWAIEAEGLGTDWPGVMATRANIELQLMAAALCRSEAHARSRAA
jgi:hypothetical protein